MAALVFKIQTDPYVGRLAYFRVYSGWLKAGAAVIKCHQKGARSALGACFGCMQTIAKRSQEIHAGDIAATLGLKSTFTGETLCAPNGPIVLESIAFPEPVISVAIEPRTTADQDKMGQALTRLAEEDPTFRVRTDENTGQMLISGMGELHLEVLVDRMLREFKVSANVGKPRVAYQGNDHPVGAQ